MPHYNELLKENYTMKRLLDEIYNDAKQITLDGKITGETRRALDNIKIRAQPYHKPTYINVDF